MRDPEDIWTQHAELVGLLQTEESFADTLLRVATMACTVIPGCTSGSATLWREGHPYTVVSTDPLAEEVDTAQYETLEGPCLDASRYGKSYVSDDLTVEGRWPVWAALAVRKGARSSMSLPLVVRGEPIGALNLYSTETGAFGEAGGVGALFAAQASVAIANAEVYHTSRALADQLEAALRAQAVVEQATGILMSDRDCPVDEAAAELAAMAARDGVPVDDVAARLVAERTHHEG